MKFDVGQSVAQIEAGTIGVPQAEIGELFDALGMGHIDTTVTSQKMFSNLYNKQIFNLVRDEDLFAWKFAKKGFFKFKENIPKINHRIIENYSKNNI